ncbi:MAG: O-antigen ligase family protein [Colwellia sp.]
MLLSNRFFNPVMSSGAGSLWPLVLFALYVVYMGCALTVPFAGKGAAGVLLLAGWVGLFWFKSGYYELTRVEKCLLGSFLLFSLVSIVSFFYWPHSRLAQMHLEDYGTFMLLIPLYLLLRQFEFNFTGMVVLLASISLFLGVVSIVQYVAMTYYHIQIFTSDNVYSKMWGRPSGGVNPMRYGGISLVLSAIAFNGVLLVKCRPALKVLLCVSSFMGLVACYLTDTRGSFLAIPALFLMYSVYLYKLQRPRFLMGLLVVCSLLLVVLSQNDRVKATLASFDSYQQGNSVTSIGARFDMFKAAIILIDKKPIWGYGLGGYLEGGKEVRKMYPNIEAHVGTWSNPHNEILLVTVEKGLIGLITLLLLFATPAYLFFRALRGVGGSVAGQKIKFYAMSGLSLLLVYSVVGQSVALFQHDVFNHFFCLMVLLFASQIRAIEYLEGAGSVSSR